MIQSNNYLMIKSNNYLFKYSNIYLSKSWNYYVFKYPVLYFLWHIVKNIKLNIMILVNLILQKRGRILQNLSIFR